MRRAPWLTGLTAAFVGLAILYWVDPAEEGWYPPCVFHLTTGLLCPGCGLTRALHQLLHGNLGGALALNALLPLYALLLGGLLLGWLWRRANGYTPRQLQIRSSLISLSAIVMVVFGVLRNL